MASLVIIMFNGLLNEKKNYLFFEILGIGGIRLNRITMLKF